MSTRLTLFLILLTLLTAVFMRFYQLGDLPPGLYQDEAYNGLDALNVLDGQHTLFFERNNGREPAYIYLTAVSIALFGNSPFALRLGAAVVGALTVLPVYALAATWFGRRTGLLAAWLWAVTLWPIHLSRIGLRAILLLPLLALLFWLGTLAWRQQKKELWLAAGAVYALAFYTYLPIRFTPLLLVALLLWLWWRGDGGRLWPGVGWFSLSTAVVLSPLLLLWFSQPDLILGRSGQVSILSPEINGGNLIGTLLGNIARALGMFIWQGDDILRHNPAQRPVFDALMALPFLLGLWLMGRQWRRLPHLTTLLWVVIMLGPTILAEDTPHFLRAVGVLPAALFITAVGLNGLLPAEKSVTPVATVRFALVMLLLAGSLGLTGRDYLAYAREAETAFLFEAAARELAEAARADVLRGSGEHGRVAIEQERFWDKQAAIRFLLADVADQISLIPPQDTSPWPLAPAQSAVLYLWPHERGLLQERATAVVPPALVTAKLGAWARGDLEPDPYPFYARYTAQPAPADQPPLAHFAEGFWLTKATITPAENILNVELIWTNDQPLPPPDLTVFVHLLDTRTGQLIAQSDTPPSHNLWPSAWWQPHLWVQDTHQLTLPEPYNPTHHQLFVGLYPSGQPAQRLPLADGSGEAYLLSDTLFTPP